MKLFTSPGPESNSEQSSKRQDALVAAVFVLAAVGIAAPQAPLTRDMVPRQVQEASDKVFSSVLGELLPPMIIQDKE